MTPRQPSPVCPPRGRRSLHSVGLGAALVVGLGLAGCKSDLDGKPVAQVRDAPANTEPAATKPEAARRLALDPAASTLAFVGAKVSGDHRGTFSSPTGQIALDGKDAIVGLDVTVQTGTLSIEPDALAEHLRSGDFFDVARYPSATFTLGKFEPTSQGPATHTVTGELELHGVRKQIEFPATVKVGSDGVSAGASFKINRKDFGIPYAGMADDLIKDEVLLELDLKFVAA